jgi:hypothetical protein
MLDRAAIRFYHTLPVHGGGWCKLHDGDSRPNRKMTGAANQTPSIVRVFMRVDGRNSLQSYKKRQHQGDQQCPVKPRCGYTSHAPL